MAEKIPSWPKVTIRLYDDHNAEVKIAGRSHPLNNSDPRAAAIQLVAERAAQLGRPMKVTAVEADGASWPLVVHPDGQVDAIDTGARKKKPIWPIVVALVVAVVLIAGTTLYVTVFSKLGDHKPVATASPKLPSLPEPSVEPYEFSPKTQPPGYTSHASWSVDIAKDSTPAIRPDGTEVAILSEDADSNRKVVVFNSEGKVLWQDKVPKDASNPVYTTIDSKVVLAVTTEDTLYYWEGDGAFPKEIELPDSATVQFFGKSPLIVLSGDNAGAMVVSGGVLKEAPAGPRLSTILLAEGDRALYALYGGPIYWTQPDKKTQQLDLQKPGGAGAVKQVVAASPDYALVLWTSVKSPDMVIPVVHSTASGKFVAVCKPQQNGDTEGWDWVPDPMRRAAAWGPCVINLSTGKSTIVPDFQPLSLAGGFIYGTIHSQLYAVSSNWSQHKLQDITRPWGIAGSHAIVVYNSVLYALDRS
ncbi:MULTISPECIES: hypothetical protein [Kribbella]|uniref:Pyrroloquinoline-quinone binding quinoprotein n=1 Tax=Kribbella karoonensis TaxID=324851 RepID=A0ABN2DZZ0_9ACTN